MADKCNDTKNELALSTEDTLVNQILDETDIDKTKKLVDLFNLNQQKKSVVRITKFNNLLDSISEQMSDRVKYRANEFSNKDLLDYLTATQNIIDKSNSTLNLVKETPAIQLQQNNQVNINVVDTIDRDSRERITNAIKSILEKVNTSQESDNIIEVEDTED